ncbi:hypothetical protein [Enterococcus sp. AZ007]|uniref:hypothetical protein n=1 Tax=Enterococcus sp. AZ007 TaxID=2774839 RepID=UPI003F256257
MIIERPNVVEFKSELPRKTEKQSEMISRSELARRWGVSIGTIKNWTDRPYDPLPMEKTTPTRIGTKEVVRIPFDLAVEWKERNTDRNYEVRA